VLIRRRTIGVAMSLYNQARYIDESLESLFDQTVRPDVVAVVDDGSDDASFQQLEKYEPFGVRRAQLGRVGVSEVLNRAAQMLNTEFIAIQAADDVSHTDRLEWQMDTYLAEQPSAVFALPTVIDEQSRPMPDSYASEFFRVSPYLDCLQRLFFSNNYLCASSAFLRRKDFFSAGCFHPGLLHLQDFLLWIRLAHRGNLRVIPERLVSYRRNSRGGNLSSPANDTRMRAELSYVYSKFFDGCPTKRMRQAFSDDRPFSEVEEHPDPTHLYMLHGDPIIKQVGLERIWKVTDLSRRVNNPGMELQAEFQHRFTESDIDRRGEQLAWIAALSTRYPWRIFDKQDWLHQSA